MAGEALLAIDAKLSVGGSHRKRYRVSLVEVAGSGGGGFDGPGRVEVSGAVVCQRDPKRSACLRRLSMRSGPMMPSGNPGKVFDLSGVDEGAECIEHRFDVGTNLVAVGANLIADEVDAFDREIGGVGELPVAVRLAGTHRECVAAAFGDHDIGRLYDDVRKGLGECFAEVEPDFGHRAHSKTTWSCSKPVPPSSTPTQATNHSASQHPPGLQAPTSH